MDQNEAAAESERNCALDDLPKINNPEIQIEFNCTENLDDQEIIKINQEPMQAPRQEEILEIKEIGNKNYNNLDDGIQDDEITGAENQNKEEDGELGKGKRKIKKSKIF